VILIDVDSLDAGDARKACILTGAFVDRLDPDDRVVIISVSSVTGVLDTTTNRLAAAGALESIISRAAALGAARTQRPRSIGRCRSLTRLPSSLETRGRSTV
jgi:hypothetical protein